MMSMDNKQDKIVMPRDRRQTIIVDPANIKKQLLSDSNSSSSAHSGKNNTKEIEIDKYSS